MSLDKAEEIKSIAASISGEPLARIMFGSRELFHSNLLAWFCETMPARATAVFDELLGRDGSPVAESAKVTVRREWQHMDLVIEWEGRERPPVVIENKVFSLPDFAQLDRYAVGLRKDVDLVDGDAVLLSLSDPKLAEQQYHSVGTKKKDRSIAWRHVSYGALSGAITNALGTTESDYATATIRHYAGLTGNLHRMATLLEVSSDEDERVYMDDVLREATSDKQLISSLSKLRARNVVTHVEKLLDSVTMKRWPSVGFSNGTPAMEISYALTNTKKSTIQGWQLQGAQFRLFAVLPSLAGRTQLMRQKRMDWGTLNQSVFNFAPYENILDRSPMSVFPDKKAFNRFDPDFIYRYVEASSITVHQLVAAGQARQHEIVAAASGLQSVRTDLPDAVVEGDPPTES